MPGERIFGTERLGSLHELDEFDCGVDSLNDYLKRQATADQAAEKSRTYVVCRDNRVVGYFSMSAASIESRIASPRAAKGQGAQPVPAILIGRLAVDSTEQGRGIGTELLVEALTRAEHAADTIGARVVLVHVIDEHARTFYLRFGFEPSPVDALHLMMLMKDIRRTI